MSLLGMRAGRLSAVLSLFGPGILETWLRYLLAIFAVVAVCVATSFLDLTAAERPSLFLFFGAIVFSAWYCGRGPGWLSVVLSILAVNYYFVPPIFVLDFSFKDIPWELAFVLSAVGTNALSLKRRRIEFQLIEARNELEQRVCERTAELQRTSEKLAAESLERSQAEAALRDTQNELARAARILTVAELTASIAHEVKQPLAAIVANGAAALNWLKRSPPALVEARESIAAVIAAGERAAEVINKTRSLMTRGKPILIRLDINQLVSSTTALIQTSFARRDILVGCHLEPGLPTVLGDRIQLQQLLLNLFGNAAEAMADVCNLPRKLVIQTRRIGGQYISITVEDTGRGLADVDPAKLFEPFYSTKPDGMGMGLAICRTIVELHGGTIRAAPRSPHGAIFHVDLPTCSS